MKLYKLVALVVKLRHIFYPTFPLFSNHARQIFQALTDIEQSIKYAEAKFSPSTLDKSTRNLVELRRSIISAAKSGNYRIGREIFGFYQCVSFFTTFFLFLALQLLNFETRICFN